MRQKNRPRLRCRKSLRIKRGLSRPIVCRLESRPRVGLDSNPAFHDAFCIGLVDRMIYAAVHYPELGWLELLPPLEGGIRRGDQYRGRVLIGLSSKSGKGSCPLIPLDNRAETEESEKGEAFQKEGCLVRPPPAEGRIFSPLLCQLSYLAV